MIKQTRYIDESTGEIYGQQERKVSAAFDEEKGYLFWVRKGQSRHFHDIDFPGEMTDLEIGRMTRLSKKVWSTTNMLGYRGNGGVKPYDVEKIGEVLKLKPRQARNFVNKMIRLGIMAKVKVEVIGKQQIQYYINPLYFSSGNRIPLNLYLIFKPYLDNLLPNWVISKYAEQKEEGGKEIL